MVEDDGPLNPREFVRRRDGMVHAMEGGLWVHRHTWRGRSLVHVVSADRERLLEFGQALGLVAERLQYKPLKDPRTAERRDAWHWDLAAEFLQQMPCPTSTAD